MIAKIKINPFIITLGSMSVAKGIPLVITKGYSVPVPDPNIIRMGQGYIGAVPIPVVIMMVIVVLMCIVYYKTIFGSNIKAMGGNEEATRISGINIEKNKTLVYLFSGLMASVADIVLTGRLNVGQPSSGTGWELDAIAAAIVGGTTLDGGEGSVPGTLIGAMLLGFLSNGMVLLNVSMYWQQIVTGVIIIGVVTLDVVRRKSR